MFWSETSARRGEETMTTAAADYLFDVSILVVSLNTRNILRECLKSIISSSGSLRVQVIVVDNASTDGSREMVEEEFPQALLIRSEVNLGFGRANNVGFQAARGRYIVLLNSDAFLTEGALEASVRHMDENPRAGLGGGRLVGRDGSWQPSARKFPSVIDDMIVRSGLASRFPRSSFFGRFDRTWANVMETAEVDWVPGAFSIIRAEALAEAGAFDPRFFLYYEEVDLCRRLKRLNYQIWYWPDITVIHIGGESSRQVPAMDMSRSGSQLTLWRMRSTLLYYRKHSGLLVAMLAMACEVLWYCQRFIRMRCSSNPERRAGAEGEKRLVAIMARAWRETKGGKLSPVQPW
jgi:GT2 family glycosyltransferase